jgi:hypothetical protein
MQGGNFANRSESGDVEITEPVTEDAKRWSGWGSALKPGHEPIVVGRKPPAWTLERNVLKHGTGAINIDGCRIDGTQGWPETRAYGKGHMALTGQGPHVKQESGPRPEGGRWPANVVLTHAEQCVEVGTRQVETGTAVKRNVRGQPLKPHPVTNGPDKYDDAAEDESYADAGGLETIPLWACVPGCPIRTLDEQSVEMMHTAGAARSNQRDVSGDGRGMFHLHGAGGHRFGDSGGASRFFYTAKAPTSERKLRAAVPLFGQDQDILNHHPTVKPLDLMRWLVRGAEAGQAMKYRGARKAKRTMLKREIGHLERDQARRTRTASGQGNEAAVRRMRSMDAESEDVRLLCPHGQHPDECPTCKAAAWERWRKGDG